MQTKKIVFQIGPVKLIATPRISNTASAIVNALPIRSTAQTWGEEVYFPANIDVPLEEDARAVVEAGEIAFWVEGKCIAIGFGKTPVSRGKEIRLATRTNIWADTNDDVKQLHQVNPNDVITVELME